MNIENIPGDPKKSIPLFGVSGETQVFNPIRPRVPGPGNTTQRISIIIQRGVGVLTITA